jgi:hypothetical protein
MISINQYYYRSGLVLLREGSIMISINQHYNRSGPVMLREALSHQSTLPIMI